MVDLDSQAAVVLEALRSKPALFYRVLKGSRNASVLSEWQQDGDAWVRWDLEGVRVRVERMKSGAWLYRLHGGEGFRGYVTSKEARVAADHVLRDEGWLLGGDGARTSAY